ncbi:MAG: ABC transporter permease, partial [Gemmatimonadota bacterium]|nr:ABC transporter permease [Gemmatimonadota bacterium]
AYAIWEPVVTVSRGIPQRLSAARISAGGVRALGVAPMLGRLPDEGEAGAVLVSPQGWARMTGHTAGSSAAIGTQLTVDGQAMTVVGVMPDGFAFPLNQQLWIPLTGSDVGLAVDIFGRLGAGATTSSSAAEMAARLLPDVAPGGFVEVMGFTESRGEGGENAALLAVLALVIVLVLVSCSNVSNLLLIRGLDRGVQLAVHQAMGASPVQVGWLVLAESSLIAGMGAVGGALVSWVAIGFIESSLSGHWGYHWMAVAFRPQTAMFLVGLAGATALLAGSMPAMRAFAADVRGGLSARGARGNSTGLGWVGPSLLTAQVTLSFLFLLAAVLIARGLWSSRAIDAGFPANDVFMASVTLPSADSGGRRGGTADALARALRAREGVHRVALATGVPGYTGPIRRIDRTPGHPPDETRSDLVPTTGVTTGFFDLFDLRVLRGRAFQAGDAVDGAPPVLIVSRAFAEAELGTIDAVGLRVALATPGADGPSTSFEVLGVVEDVRIYATQPRGRPVYLPLSGNEAGRVFMLFSAPGLNQDEARAAVVRAVALVNPDLPLDGVPGAGTTGTVRAVLDYIHTLYSTAGIMGILGGAAAVLVAAIGLYGVLSYEMRRRRHELGIRVALGAGRGRVAAEVVRRGILSLAPGLLLGCAGALATLPLLGTLLGSANSRNAALFLAVAGAYALIGFATSLPPALKACRIDPNLTLRED